MLQPFHLAIPVDDLEAARAFMVTSLAVKRDAAVITGSTTTFWSSACGPYGAQR